MDWLAAYAAVILSKARRLHNIYFVESNKYYDESGVECPDLAETKEQRCSSRNRQTGSMGIT